LNENLQNLILNFVPRVEILRERDIENPINGAKMISGTRNNVTQCRCNNHWSDPKKMDKINYTWGHGRTRKGFTYDNLQIYCDCSILESNSDPYDFEYEDFDGPYIHFFTQNDQLLLFIAQWLPENEIPEYILTTGNEEEKIYFEKYANLKYLIYGSILNIEKLKEKIPIINGCIFESLKQHFEMDLLTEWFVEKLDMSDE
jgi:hypothetical protein